MSFCPHCHSGHDPVLVQSTWSCGVRYNDPSWRTKECYKRNLELANERIHLLQMAGNELLWSLFPESTGVMTESQRLALKRWNKAKEAKP